MQWLMAHWWACCCLTSNSYSTTSPLGYYSDSIQRTSRSSNHKHCIMKDSTLAQGYNYIHPCSLLKGITLLLCTTMLYSLTWPIGFEDLFGSLDFPTLNTYFQTWEEHSKGKKKKKKQNNPTMHGHQRDQTNARTVSRLAHSRRRNRLLWNAIQAQFRCPFLVELKEPRAPPHKYLIVNRLIALEKWQQQNSRAHRVHPEDHNLHSRPADHSAEWITHYWLPGAIPSTLPGDTPRKTDIQLGDDTTCDDDLEGAGAERGPLILMIGLPVQHGCNWEI